MAMIRLTPCGCDRSRYRLLPRRLWMRLLGSRRRYRCATCKATMLLSEGRLTWRQRLVVAVAIAFAVWGSLWIAGYLEESREAAWKRWVSQPPV